MVKILVIEDDDDIADFIKHGLVQKGFSVRVAVNGLDGLEVAKSTNPDIVILDLMLPDIDGIDVCRELRASGDIGIVILTARHMIGDRVMGLEAGADDYLIKPFAFEELTARIRAVLRRKKFLADAIIRIGDLELDTKRRTVSRGDTVISLTKKEYELLTLLAENADRPVRREVILSQVWGDDFETDSDPVKVYINSLRRKLNSGGKANLIQVLRGFGYALRE